MQSQPFVSVQNGDTHKNGQWAAGCVNLAVPRLRKDFRRPCNKMQYFLPHLVSALLATTSLVEQISIFQAFQVVPACLLAQAPHCFPFLLSVLQDQLFLFFRIFQEVPWDLEDLSFPLVPSCHVVPSLQWDQDIRGVLQDILSHLTYSTWWA